MPRTEIYDFEIVIYFYTHIDILCLNIFFQLGEYQTAELNVGPSWHLYTRYVSKVRRKSRPCHFKWVYTYVLCTQFFVITFQIKLEWF